MSFYIEPLGEKNKTLKLIGSQINLTPRSDHSAFGSFTSKSCRLTSPSHSFRTQNRHTPKCSRPKSADCGGAYLYKDDSLLTVSDFTDSSSKLLQHLIESSDLKTSVIQEKNFFSDSNSVALKNLVLERAVPESIMISAQPERSHQSSKINSFGTYSDDECNTAANSLGEKLKGFKLEDLFPEGTEEKTVRFSNKPHENKFDRSVQCPHFGNRGMLCARSKSEILLSHEQIYPQQRKRKSSDPEKLTESETQKAVKSNKCDLFKNSPSANEVGVSENRENKEINCERLVKFHTDNYNNEQQQPVENSNDNFEKSLLDDKSKSPLEPNLEVLLEKKKEIDEGETSTQNFLSGAGMEEPIKCEEENKASNSNPKINFSDSTYEEIVRLLQTLDEEDPKSPNADNKEVTEVEIPSEASSEEKNDYFEVVSSYLEEVELQGTGPPRQSMNGEKWDFEGFSSPRLEDLLNKNSVELAHEVFSLKIQITDQKKGIKLLKDTLAEMKEAKKSADLEHQEAMQKVSAEAEALVQRHQKFIKQLLAEKNNLNQTVSKLVEDLKLGEEKHKRNMKAIEEKHAVEIKRAKEAQALADKIKREKWMEVKTQKIKEMTVKGLEPELSRMAVRQQEEMTELRNLHKAEIEAIELRAARRTADLMDELRAELTKEKERLVAQETSALRADMENKFEEERNNLQQNCLRLKDSVRKLEEKLSKQQVEFEQKLMDVKEEEEKKRQKVERDHQESVEDVRRQHSIDLRNLRESLEAEKEICMSNYRKKQAAEFSEKEAQLHQQYKRERDREIEVIIETLESEASQIQSQLTVAGETKLKRLREKMEAEMKEMEESEAALKVKLSESKSKLLEKDDFISELNSQIRQLQTELSFVRKSCDEMSSEKAKMKEIIREEFQNSLASMVRENEDLRKEMAVCKELHAKELTKKDQLNIQTKREMQKQLTRVYSRIKMAVNKKEEVIESLQQENKELSQKCRQLELMLDNQRRNLLL